MALAVKLGWFLGGGGDLGSVSDLRSRPATTKKSTRHPIVAGWAWLS